MYFFNKNFILNLIFSLVIKTRDATNEAIIDIQRENDNLSRLTELINNLPDIGTNQNIVRYYGYFKDYLNSYMVLEYCKFHRQMDVMVSVFVFIKT